MTECPSEKSGFLTAKEEERMDTGSQPAGSAMLQGREILSKQHKHEGECVACIQEYFMKPKDRKCGGASRGAGSGDLPETRAAFFFCSSGAAWVSVASLYTSALFFSLCARWERCPSLSTSDQLANFPEPHSKFLGESSCLGQPGSGVHPGPVNSG